MRDTCVFVSSSLCLSVCCSVSVPSHLCLFCIYGAKFCKPARGSFGVVRTLSKFHNSIRGGYIMKEPTWTFDVDYVTQNNRSS